MNREAAPAGADVQHPLAFPEAELRADEVELCLLRCLERVGAAGEDRAGVRHRLVEKEAEELVRDVVVVADRAAVALTGVALALGAQLGGRRPWRQRQAGGAERGEEQSQLVA